MSQSFRIQNNAFLDGWHLFPLSRVKEEMTYALRVGKSPLRGKYVGIYGAPGFFVSILKPQPA